MLHKQITSHKLDYSVASLASLVTAILLLFFGIKAVTRFAERPFDVVLGLLVAFAVAAAFLTLSVQLMRLRPSN